MARLAWSAIGSRFFEAGVDRGVLYVGSNPGVPWSGLISVEEKPSGGSARSYYLDGIKYMHISSAEEFRGTVNAFTYPVEFTECDGTARVRPGLLLTQQRRTSFGLCYRVKIGNDTSGVDYGYKLHLVYNALAEPAARTYTSFGTSPTPSDFSWDLTTKPVAMPGYRRSSHVVIDSRDVPSDTVSAIEDILYGTDEDSARLPTLVELIELYDALETITVTDNGGGLFTISGPDDAIQNLGSDIYEITGDEVELVDPDTYSITS